MLETREGGCHCGRVRFRAEVDLDRLTPFELPRRRSALTSYTFGTGVAQQPTRFFDGRHWEGAQRRRIAESGQAPPPDAHGAKTLQAILDRALA
ncbi:MAG: hypothetical protein NTV97_31725 [Alphaproteobacteria bacterium]|nr:hypothetical protein [Alphaproteobacteria bacterium]